MESGEEVMMRRCAADLAQAQRIVFFTGAGSMLFQESLSWMIHRRLFNFFNKFVQLTMTSLKQWARILELQLSVEAETEYGMV